MKRLLRKLAWHLRGRPDDFEFGTRPVLFRRADRARLRHATPREYRESLGSPEREGDGGVIPVGGVECYVLD